MAREGYERKVRKAAAILLYRRHRKPGVKGWELRRELGSDFKKVLEVLDKYLEPLGLRVNAVLEDSSRVPTGREALRARYFITVRDEMTLGAAKTCGWRIDDLAGLAICLAYISSRGGSAPQSELEKLLEEKLPGWRARMNLRRFVRAGYLREEGGRLMLGWRAKAEVDLSRLVDAILRSEETHKG